MKPNNNLILNSTRQLDKDILRIILVILVVIGHGSYYDIITKYGGIKYGQMMELASISDTLFHRLVNSLTRFIYTFHMPLFIALSGSLFVLKKDLSTMEFIKAKAKRLLVPFFVVWLFWNLPIKYLTNYYDGVDVKGILLQMIFPASVYLWYLECLFFVFVIAHFICKMKIENQIMIVGISYIIGIVLYRKLDQYHVLGDPLYYLFWFYIGYRIENIISCLKRKKIWEKFPILVIFIVSCLLYIVNRVIKVKLVDLISTYLIYPFLMLFVLNYVVRHIKIDKSIAKKMSDYGFGIYLYAEPLNYLFLFLFSHRIWNCLFWN